MDAFAVQLDCARVGLVAAAESRGVVDQSPSPSAADWLMAHSTSNPPTRPGLVDLARAFTQPRNQVLAAAVSGGTITVRKAVTALRQLA